MGRISARTSLYMQSACFYYWVHDRVFDSVLNPQVDGILTSKNAGGNPTYPTFMVNPQYHLRIHPLQKSTPGVQASKIKTRVVLTMHSRKDTPVNIMAVWSQGERVTEWVSLPTNKHPGDVLIINFLVTIDWRRRRSLLIREHTAMEWRVFRKSLPVRIRR